MIDPEREVEPSAAAARSVERRAGRSRKRKRLRKEEIVAEATRLFAERGYEGASMGDLAERVGLRKASLFHHFPSKDVLYATVLDAAHGEREERDRRARRWPRARSPSASTR